MKTVTSEQVRGAVLAAGIDYIPHHECGGCGFEVSYGIRDGELYFSPACDCSRHYSRPEPRDWQDAADWINMQSDQKHRVEIAARFGLILDPTPPTQDGAKHAGEGGR